MGSLRKTVVKSPVKAKTHNQWLSSQREVPDERRASHRQTMKRVTDDDSTVMTVSTPPFALSRGFDKYKPRKQMVTKLDVMQKCPTFRSFVADQRRDVALKMRQRYGKDKQMNKMLRLITKHLDTTNPYRKRVAYDASI